MWFLQLLTPWHCGDGFLWKITIFDIMDTLQVDILNPKANRLLKDLAALGLIAIKPIGNDGFQTLVDKIRSTAGDDLPSLTEITEEVEIVRSQRYAKKKA